MVTHHHFFVSLFAQDIGVINFNSLWTCNKWCGSSADTQLPIDVVLGNLIKLWVIEFPSKGDIFGSIKYVLKSSLFASSCVRKEKLKSPLLS